ncbi:MAG: YraN family protein [Bacteroidales bacterium]|nr:YraN family protein [Bacteroidales bacterium]
MSDESILGKLGEKFAAEFLRKKGYKILATNWRFGKEEIDIIAKDGEYIVIVEVKTRSSDYFGDPEDSVTRKKQKSIVKAADNFICKKNINNETRFDVIGIVFEEGKPVFNHIVDAFYPTL